MSPVTHPVDEFVSRYSLILGREALWVKCPELVIRRWGVQVAILEAQRGGFLKRGIVDCVCHRKMATNLVA
ncbi:hypothetical protein N7495_008437 [Penicillium taxi]|uniref:uncharacterized protein n=1 Tax=Penicillium taxi TaxID=168475 RepID=UPI00254507FA|nr:uncharacterized protein N7495_008437 [Penicillium taxi]KAJ5888396.1 hypothetical protein N7495_008437 [Penicillium taxi]